MGLFFDKPAVPGPNNAGLAGAGGGGEVGWWQSYWATTCRDQRSLLNVRTASVADHDELRLD